MDELFQQIRQIVSETKYLPAESVQLDSTFEALGMDSLDGLNIVFELEKTYGISVANDKVLQVRTIRDIVTTLEATLRETRGAVG